MQGVSKQADRLIEALEQDRSVNMKEDWKLLTIWIGANNECPSCHGSKADSTAVYGAELEATLQKLQTKVPRLFVSCCPAASRVLNDLPRFSVMSRTRSTPVACPICKPPGAIFLG